MTAYPEPPAPELPSQDDIFGKIDALLGKRAGFAGPAHKRDDWDFPLLTDVVAEESPELTLDLAEAFGAEVPDGPREAILPKAAPPRLNIPDALPESPFHEPAPSTWEAVPEALPVAPSEEAPDAGVDPGQSLAQDRLMAMESRLMDHLAEHEARMETRFRAIVREELERLLGRP